MDVSENSFMRKSQLRPPSRIPGLPPSPGKGLSEISESETNVRSKPSGLQQPKTTTKSNLFSSSIRIVNEMEPKRKTLAERAGEPARSNVPPVTIRPTIKGTSLVGAGASFNGPRNTSFASSTSSRSGMSSRTASNCSYANSVGPGTRPPSSYSNRPQTSMAFSKSTSTRAPISRPQTSMASKRPASSMDDLEDGPSDGKRQGTKLCPNSSFDSSRDNNPQLQVSKLRGNMLKNVLRSLPENMSLREVSVSTALSRLHIDDSDSNHDFEGYKSPAKYSTQSLRLPNRSSYAAMRKSKLDSYSALVLFQDPDDSLVTVNTPSQIPVRCRAEASFAIPATPTKASKSRVRTSYLTKNSNIPAFIAWDVNGRIEDMEAMYHELKSTLNGSHMERNGLETVVTQLKARLLELEGLKAQLESKNSILQIELDTTQQRLLTTRNALDDNRRILDDERRSYRIDLEDQKRERRNEYEHKTQELEEGRRREVEKIRRDLTEEVERLIKAHREEVRELERRCSEEVEHERRQRVQEVTDIKSQIVVEQRNLDVAVGSKEREIQNMRGELEDVKGELDREQILKGNLQKNLTESSSTIMTLESSIRTLRAHVEFLESGSKAQSDSFVSLERQMQEALASARESKAKLIKEETLRRILFNQVQELKGNIRVMCRVRPRNNNDPGDDLARIAYPDTDKESRELEVQGPEEKSSLGNISRKTNAFAFDQVFGPTSSNENVFEEISQLVQSALDGYNVCIFCYGQTGAGKTYTMSSADGMIPRATHQIYETAKKLEEKGWSYSMEGSFIEVYNEDIHDLLGNPKEYDKKKHEIRHDEAKKQTTITGLKSILLDSPDSVESILKQAAANRSVAATKSNERSSRSHSVFILKLVGKNSTTDETSEGTLNLVDLAGSERLKISGAEGDRMKETQNINKSLSCLGDVIGALGQGKEGAHIPYRNSKLTYLLQFSLGGNSKTLMFVMISPLEAHLKETLTSLKFATKVHNTHIGTAKKTKKIGD